MNYQLNFSYKVFEDNQRSLIGLKVQHYKVIDLVGKGTYSEVYKALNTKTIKLVAIKVLDKYQLENKTTNKQRRDKIMRYIKSEGEMLSQFKNDYILPLQSVYQNKQLKLIITKFCNQGNLMNEIETKGTFYQDQAVNVLLQISNGLAAMHSINMIHRDLKPDNIFKNNGRYFIGDFGLAKFMLEQETSGHTRCGSYTRAPQVESGSYSLSADIWSLGVIFLQMIYFGKDFNTKERDSLIENQFKNMKFYDGQKISEAARNFLCKTLVLDPCKRISWRDLKNHIIFKKYDDKQASILSNVFLLKVNPISTIETTEIMKNSKFYQSFIEIEEEEQEDENYQQFSISKIQVCSQDDEKWKNFQDDQSRVYNKICEFHLNCKISEFILQQYIEKIREYQLFDIKEKKTRQLMYLLASRCFFYLSKTNYQSEILNSSFFTEEFKILSESAISNLYQRAKQKYDEYEKLLSISEGSFRTIIKEKIGVSGKTYYQNLPVFTDIQGMSYTKKQQIKLTQKYLNQMKINPTKLSKIMKQRYPNNEDKQNQKLTKQLFSIELYLSNYEVINNIEKDLVEKVGFQKSIEILLKSN